MAHNREDGLCCGSVLTLIKEPPVAAEVGKVRLAEAAVAGADTVVALCPCCEFQLRVSADKKGSPVEVVDLARYAASALGHEFPDPEPGGAGPVGGVRGDDRPDDAGGVRRR